MKAGQFKQILKEAVREVLREEMAYSRSLTESFNPQNNNDFLTEQAQPIKLKFGTNMPVHTIQTNTFTNNSSSPFASIFKEVASNMTGDDVHNIRSSFQYQD